MTEYSLLDDQTIQDGISRQDCFRDSLGTELDLVIENLIDGQIDCQLEQKAEAVDNSPDLIDLVTDNDISFEKFNELAFSDDSGLTDHASPNNQSEDLAYILSSENFSDFQTESCTSHKLFASSKRKIGRPRVPRDTKIM